MRDQRPAQPGGAGVVAGGTGSSVRARAAAASNAAWRKASSEGRAHVAVRRRSTTRRGVQDGGGPRGRAAACALVQRPQPVEAELLQPTLKGTVRERARDVLGSPRRGIAPAAHRRGTDRPPSRTSATRRTRPGSPPGRQPPSNRLSPTPSSRRPSPSYGAGTAEGRPDGPVVFRPSSIGRAAAAAARCISTRWKRWPRHRQPLHRRRRPPLRRRPPGHPSGGGVTGEQHNRGPEHS